jgi:hypothetical protein
MAVDLINEAYNVQGLTTNQRMVLVTLANRAREKDSCWPSVASLMEDCCMSRSTVFDCLRELERRGLVARDSRAKEHQSNVYRVFPGKVRTVDPLPSAIRTHPRPQYGPGTVNKNRKEQNPPIPPQPDPCENWQDWVSYKKSKRQWTPATEKLSRRELVKLAELGYSPVEVIEQSISRGWSGLFEVSGVKGTERRQPLSNARQEAADAIWGRGKCAKETLGCDIFATAVRVG